MDPLDGRAPLDLAGLLREPPAVDLPDLAAIPSFLRQSGEQDEAGSDVSATVSGAGTSGLLDGRHRASVVGTATSPEEGAPDPAALPLATISPRRLLQAVAVVALTWGLISFGRQVASATAASSHADELRSANAHLQREVAALQGEFALIQEPRYVNLAARAYRLGTSKEIPFALEAGAPALPADAPGSAAVRVGANQGGSGPLESWLHLLFGPG